MPKRSFPSTSPQARAVLPARAPQVPDNDSFHAPEASAVPMVGAHQARSEKRRRRTFTAAQKRAIIAEAERCTEPGDIGALLRKHGLYSSTLSRWRRALATDGELRSAGRPPTGDERDKEIASLQRRIEQLEARAKRAEGLVDLQKKALSLLAAASTLGELS